MRCAAPVGGRHAIGGRDEIALWDLERLAFAGRPAVEALAEFPQRRIALGRHARADVDHGGAFPGELREIEPPARKR